MLWVTKFDAAAVIGIQGRQTNWRLDGSQGRPASRGYILLIRTNRTGRFDHIHCVSKGSEVQKMVFSMQAVPCRSLDLRGKLRDCGMWESSSEEMNLPFGSLVALCSP